MKCHLGDLSVRLSPTKEELNADVGPSPKKTEPPANVTHSPKKMELSSNARHTPIKMEPPVNVRHTPKKVEMSGTGMHSPKKIESLASARDSPKKMETPANAILSAQKMESSVDKQLKNLWPSDSEEPPHVGHLRGQPISYTDFSSLSARCVESAEGCKPARDKENKNETPLHNVCRTLYLEDSEIRDDSGYASTQNSHLMEFSDDSIFAVPLDDTPNRFVDKTSHSHSNKLPIVRFEDVVCSTLKRTIRRNPKLDWHLVDNAIAHTDFELHKIIGRKMGLDRVDVLGELFLRDFKHLVAKILRHLNDMDLINVAGVSKTWNKLLTSDNWAFSKYLTTLDTVHAKDTKYSPESATRTYALHRAALTSVQKAVSPNSKSLKKLNRHGQTSGSCVPHSRHAEFSEVAKTLKNDESLKVCVRCRSPAKFDSYTQRATCSRTSCGFDFCTRCLCNYHFSKSCISNKPQTPGIRLVPLPGSKKSKQNLRRL